MSKTVKYLPPYIQAALKLKSGLELVNPRLPLGSWDKIRARVKVKDFPGLVNLIVDIITHIETQEG